MQNKLPVAGVAVQRIGNAGFVQNKSGVRPYTSPVFVYRRFQQMVGLRFGLNDFPGRRIPLLTGIIIVEHVTDNQLDARSFWSIEACRVEFGYPEGKIAISFIPPDVAVGIVIVKRR